MVKTKTLIAVSIFFLSVVALKLNAQNLDSLKTELKKSTDTNKVDILLQIVDQTMYSEPNLALEYALQSYNISRELNDTFRVFSSANNIGIIYNERGDYKNAIYYFENVLNLITKDSLSIARTYGNIGNSYMYESDNEKALYYYLKSLKIFEALKHDNGMSLIYGTLGNLYLTIKDYKNAFDSYKNAEKLFLKLDNSSGLATVYMNIGNIYRDSEKEYDKAITNYKRALKIYNNFNYQRGIAQSQGNIGECLYQIGEYNKSLESFTDAVKIFRESKNYEEEALALIWIGDINTKIGDLKLAQQYYFKAYNLANEQSSITNLENSSRSIYNNFKEQKNFVKALEFHEKYLVYHDSIFNIAKESKLQELLSKYDTEKKEKEIQQQQFELEKKQLQISKKEAVITFYIILVILITVGLILVAFAYFQKKRINKLLNGQNLLIEKQNKVLARDKLILEDNLKDKVDILDKIYLNKKETELPPELLSLSKREMEVLSYLALGWTDKEISEKLFVSVSTTKTHLRRIYSKLLVKGRASAVAIAHKYNIIGGVDNIED